MRSRLTGLTKARAQIANYRDDFKRKVGGALYVEAGIEKTEAQRRCPVWNPERPLPPGHQPGTLRASGRVSLPQFSGNKIFVLITFGTDYALYVHEDLDAFHAIGRARFLSSTLEESSPYMAARVARRLRS